MVADLSNVWQRRCFISSPSPHAARKFAALMRERGYAVQDSFSATAISDSEQALEIIRGADVILGVLEADSLGPQMLVELGAALGAAKPLMLFGESAGKLPAALQMAPFVRGTNFTTESLALHLDSFLKQHLGVDRSERRQLASSPSSLDLPKEDTNAVVNELRALWLHVDRPREAMVISALQRLFESVGFPTSTTAQIHADRVFRPDLAVWVDDLPSSLGNPLIVEIDLGSSDPYSKWEHFRHLLSTANAKAGLLVRQHPDRPVLQAPRSSTPVIVTVSIAELIDWVASGDFSLKFSTAAVLEAL